MDEKRQYDEAVKAIKKAILQSQYEAARSVNEKQLMLYYITPATKSQHRIQHSHC